MSFITQHVCSTNILSNYSLSVFINIAISLLVCFIHVFTLNTLHETDFKLSNNYKYYFIKRLIRNTIYYKKSQVIVIFNKKNCMEL